MSNFIENLTDYQQFRGKCRELSEAAVAASDGALRLARGWYICPLWGRQEHWWAVRISTGEIVDPTVRQFPTNGLGAEYEEFNGVVACVECGKEITEEEAAVYSHGSPYAVCSGRCYGRMVGVPCSDGPRTDDLDVPL